MLIIQNHPSVTAGIYGRYLVEKRIPHRTLRLFAGDPLPEPGEAAAVIVLGGYMGVHDTAEYAFLEPLMRFMAAAAHGGTPLLGICLGGQLLSAALGGRVTATARGEKGMSQVTLTAAGTDDPLFAGLPPRFAAFEWHNDSFDVPAGAVHLASSASCQGQAFRFHNAYGVQFHPEVDAEIVASWSAKSDPTGQHLARFLAAEAVSRTISLRLLENFLLSTSLLSSSIPNFRETPTFPRV